MAVPNPKESDIYQSSIPIANAPEINTIRVYPYHPFKQTFLAHLSRRLKGELIVYRSIRRPCVCVSVRP